MEITEDNVTSPGLANFLTGTSASQRDG